MFNKYVWELYLKSGGQELVDFFRNNLLGDFSEEYIQRMCDLQRKYCVSDEIVKGTERQLTEIYEVVKGQPVDTELNEVEDISDEDLEYIFSDFYEKELQDPETSDKDAFSRFSNCIAYTSTLLALDTYGAFVPYYFWGNYNVLSTIAETFDIELPPVPKKSDYRGRVWHYLSLCSVFGKFRRENGLSTSELLAFLYDFAPNSIGGKDSYILKELPQSKSAFFIGGGGDNDDATAEDKPENIEFWQCNPDTRAGDMIVMYLRTPISSISSIWRSYSVGFIDPFFYYYRCTYIGEPKKIKRLSLDAIKSDKILGKMPIVNKNMQGINGVELKPSEYNRVVEISTADVPKLEYVMSGGNENMVNEKAVEEKLIKPLLSKLDYTETDYVQQLSVPVGNHNRALIPDFVLLHKCNAGHHSAFAIIEAKRSITSAKQLEDVKAQARSYSKLLGVRYSVIASQEGIWVSSSKDDYSENIAEYTWEVLKDGDTFYRLSQILGKQ